MEPAFKRILLKLSGEVLAGEKKTGIDFGMVETVSERIKTIVEMGVEVGIVIGGGNFWRGRSSGSMDRTRADSMGMLATVINCLALCDTLEQMGVKSTVMTAVDMNKIAEPFTARGAKERLEKGEVVIFGAGTGNPFFSTDTGAALRAAEINADVIFKATNVDGVYDSDPNKNPDAKKFDTLTHSDVLAKDLHVMDAAAASLCRDNDINILVFNLNDPDNIVRAVKGEKIGTLVK
jgi:uridylate kinase